MSCASEYAPELRARGFRMTSQRMAILHALRHSRRHLSPAEVYERARRDVPALTETTVYRTLEFLARNNLAWPTHTASGHLTYEIAGSDHHHMLCQQCGGELEIQNVLLKSFYTRLEKASGYLLTNKHLTLLGLCPRCQRN